MSHSHHGRRGVTAIEYAILCFLIAIALLGILNVTGIKLKEVFTLLGSTIENATGPAASAPALPFGAFETFNATAGTGGFCSVGNQISGFPQLNGNGVLTPNYCSSGGALSQSAAYSNITGNTLSNNVVISNQSPGHGISVPAIQGAGTGFSVPASSGAVTVYLYKTDSNSSYAFMLQSPSDGFNATNLASAKTACSNIGGNLTYSTQYAFCNHGSLYTGAQFAAVLPPQ